MLNLKEKTQKAKKERGITLVALVITIIILLILATISIQSLTNTGLFQKANEAKEKTQNATENQAKTLNEYEDELNKYISGTTEKTKKLVDEVKVGDYVKYTPDTLNDEALATLKANLNTYSGNSSGTVNPAIKRDDLNWRVLDVQNGQVRLISEVPTESKIELKGYNGYNNAVKLLDDACSTLYNNSKLASKVQNLKIEDITKYMTTQPTEGTTPYSPTNIKYPKILENEENQTVVNSTTSNKLGVSKQDGVVTGNDTSATSTLKRTYWSQSMNSTDSFTDSKYYELFIENNGSKYPTYWMSSRCVDADSDGASFNVHRVNSGNVNAYTLYSSNGREYSLVYAFRPVITLNSNVQIDAANLGDGSIAEQAYVIK